MKRPQPEYHTYQICPHRRLMSAPFCICGDNPELSSTAIHWISIGVFMGIFLQAAHLYDSLIRPSRSRTTIPNLSLQIAYVCLFWIIWAVCIALQVTLSIKRPHAEKWTFGCGPSCSPETSFLFDQVNIYAFPDISYATVFVYGTLVIFWDCEEQSRLNWRHAISHFGIITLYNVAELTLQRTTVVLLVCNVLMSISLYVILQFALTDVLRPMLSSLSTSARRDPRYSLSSPGRELYLGLGGPDGDNGTPTSDSKLKRV